MRNKIPLTRERLIKKYLGDSKFKVLDVGCGNNSALRIKSFFPSALYYGIDKDKGYNLSQNDFSLMEEFYELDVSSLDFKCIKNDYYDLIIMSHIIEHLYNGEEVIKELLPKLKKGGYIYIEYPSFRSTFFPSMNGTLNFFDDFTHVRLYSLLNLYNLLMKAGMSIIQGGTRRSIIKIILIPYYIIRSFLMKKKLRASILWDLYGFAEFVFARKK